MGPVSVTLLALRQLAQRPHLRARIPVWYALDPDREVATVLAVEPENAGSLPGAKASAR